MFPVRERPGRLVAHTAVVIGVALTLLAGCTVGPSLRPEVATSGGPPPPRTATTSTAPMGPGGSGRATDPIRWLPCPPSVSAVMPDGGELLVDCADVPAPISHPQPQRGMLTFSVSRARLTDVERPPLVLLTDVTSPGRAAIAEIVAGLPGELLDHFSIIVVDPRGSAGTIDCVGESTAQAIVGLAADPRGAAGAAQLEAIARQLTFDCGDEIGPALTKFNSTNAADDLDILRAALRVDQLSILADGTGATIGALYAHRFPGRVASVVLTSPGDPSMDLAARAAAQAAAAEAALMDFAAFCQELAEGCPLGAEPEAALREIVDRFAGTGVAVGPWVVTGGTALLALLELLPDRDTWPALAEALADLQRGDGTRLKDLVVTSGGTALTARLSERVIYFCNDMTERPSMEEIAQWADAAPGLFGPFTAALTGLCSAWPAPDEPADRLSGTGAPPILVAGAVGSIDPPFTETRSVAGQLASAVLVSWQSVAARPYPASSCITSVVNAYLLSGVVPERGVLCPP